jgi:hypothetical protein
MKHVSRAAFAVGLSTGLAIGWAPAGAAVPLYTYTLEVPVTVKNLPLVAKSRVICVLLSGKAETSDYNSSDVPLVKGAFSGTVSVSIGSDKPATGYTCRLQVAVGGVSGGQPINVANATYENAIGWTGTMIVSGNLP